MMYVTAHLLRKSELLHMTLIIHFAILGKEAFLVHIARMFWHGVLLRAVLITVISLNVIWRLNIIFRTATTMWQFFLYPKTTKKTEVR